MGDIKDQLKLVLSSYKLGTLTLIKLIYQGICYLCRKFKELTRFDGFITFIVLTMLFFIIYLTTFVNYKAKYIGISDKLDSSGYHLSRSIDSLKLIHELDSITINKYEWQIDSLKAVLIKKSKTKKVIKNDSI